MHPIQEQLIKLSADRDVASMKLAEIARIIGVKHLQQVKHHRDQLIKKGLLAAPQTARAPRIMKDELGQGSDLLSIPVLGAANAGPATIYADSKVQGYLLVSSKLLPKISVSKLFALKVVGRSMNRASVGEDRRTIDNDDYVIVDGTTPYQPVTGHYVVSNINGVANIKKFVKDDINKQIVLMSESTDDYPPIVIHEDDVLAQSKIVYVVKQPKLS
jgi:SOS-response transcriptional repressor LexA